MKTRVLIVDDSVVIRKMVGDILGAEPDMELVGRAANGRLALQMIPQVNPDVIVLDVEMPELNGIETLKELRKTYKQLPVIMFSTLTGAGAKETVEALFLGASDYAQKPSNSSIEESSKAIRCILLEKIRTLSPVTRLAQQSAAQASLQVKATSPNKKIDLVVVGASTGGPNALSEFFSKIPTSFTTPILVTQHMPPVFTKLLAERLSSKSKYNITEGENKLTLLSDTAYIAPGDFHMGLRKDGFQVSIELNQNPPENSCRPAVDYMFRSAAEIFGGNILGIIFTGMGQDGLRGTEKILENGGSVIVQDEATSVVWGMPGVVAKAGLASAVLPLSEIVPEMVRRTQAVKMGKI
ncbi:MAG: chemotaxis response regulator protein-glutamate methylesterase [Deltaproteobacteria bacterium]|nr:chemotaxis response regulator protein-glutamate methylesterase [Deltaproteobacteria bacterium]